FLGSEEDVQNNTRGFSKRRHMEKPTDGLNRLYAVESLMSLTGFNADHRLRIASSAVVQVAGAIAAEVTKQGGLESLGKLNGDQAKWASQCAKDLLAHKGESLVVAGHRQPLAVHLLAYAINDALGNIGKTLVFHEVPDPKAGRITELAQALNAG